MKVYALTATGPLRVVNGTKQHLHKRVFLNREDAENAKDAFLDSCCNSPFGTARELGDLDPDSAEVAILELELVGDATKLLPACEKKTEARSEPFASPCGDCGAGYCEPCRKKLPCGCDASFLFCTGLCISQDPNAKFWCASDMPAVVAYEKQNSETTATK